MARRAAAKLAQETDPALTNFEYDNTFFPITAIRVGVKLKNYGKRDPGAIWEVTAIHTYKRRPSGSFDLLRVSEVQHLSDLISIKRVVHDTAMVNQRRPTFGSIAYSAIWRLA